MISSVMPSAKYSSLGSGLKLANGRTATLCVSSCVVENAGGMKLFDRAGSVGCKGNAHVDPHLQNQQLWVSVPVCVGQLVRTHTRKPQIYDLLDFERITVIEVEIAPAKFQVRGFKIPPNPLSQLTDSGTPRET